MTRARVLFAISVLASLLRAPAAAQQVRVGDLTVNDGDVPVRLLGYGLVVGLDGTGDRAQGVYGSRHTVQSIVNLLRNFDIEVPAELLRTRNVAAVLVTAEASPYLRSGGRVDVQVSSIGDARSLRGGVLWATPLVSEPGGPALAIAQGAAVLSENPSSTNSPVETSARVPAGGLITRPLPRTGGTGSRILLKEPNLTMATRIAAAIEADLGTGSAQVEDPGSILLKLPEDEQPPVALARIADVKVDLALSPRIIIDGRSGTIAAGGDIVVRPAVVSHGGVTVSVGEAAGDGADAGAVRFRSGTTVQEVASTLQSIGAPTEMISAVFEALRSVGAMTADIIVR